METQRRRLRHLHQLHDHIARNADATPVAASSSAAEPRRPLAGIRVVELASVMAAPVAAAVLADYGAEVIKIEDPRGGDIVRQWGSGDDPDKTADPVLHATAEGGGSSFVQLNRGKKSVALNPTTPEGKAVLLKLLATADVLVTNVRLRSLRKAGLDYESVALLFPELIYAHLSAFGLGGDMVDDPGYDFGAFWAQSGLMDIVKSGEDAPPPREPGGIGDYNCGRAAYGQCCHSFHLPIAFAALRFIAGHDTTARG